MKKTNFKTMKIPYFLAVLLVGCAETSVRDGTSGRVKFKTQANAADVYYSDGRTVLHIQGLDHATPTTAAYNGGSLLGQTVGQVVVGAIVAHGLSGTATTTQTVVRSTAAAAPVTIPQKAVKPAATPAPKLVKP